MLLGRRRRDDPLAELTPRERDVLALMAEGRSNRAMADALVVSERAVEKHVTAIFSKLCRRRSRTTDVCWPCWPSCAPNSAQQPPLLGCTSPTAHIHDHRQTCSTLGGRPSG